MAATFEGLDYSPPQEPEKKRDRFNLPSFADILGMKSENALLNWHGLFGKNLSVKDMLSLLEETRDAAKMRHKSVETQLQLSRARMRNRGILPTPESSASVNKMTDEDLQKIIRGE